MKIFHVGSHQFRDSLWELLRELRFSYWSSREMPFREWNVALRESDSEFRELLREYPRSLRELREWPFHSESVFSPQASEFVLCCLIVRYRHSSASAKLYVTAKPLCCQTLGVTHRTPASGWPRFGYSSRMERFQRFRFSVPTVPLGKGFSVLKFSTA